MGRVLLDKLTAASRALNEPEGRRREMWESFHDRASELDGHVFECVTSTRIYCRPTCGVHRPKFENCLFVASSAEAEALGFRPCLRCRPELAPGVKRTGDEEDLSWRVLSLLGEYCSGDVTPMWIARFLEVGEQDAEQAARERYGAGFEALLLSCRLHLVKILLTDTRIGVEAVARACGFGDVSDLSRALRENFRLVPADFRKKQSSPVPEGVFCVPLAYRLPFEFDKLLGFFRDRELAGVEVVDDVSYSRTARIVGLDGTEYAGWVRVENDAAHSCLRLTASVSLLPVVSQVIARVRRQFDLDADPIVVHAALQPLEGVVAGSNVCGTRVPGAFDSFEIATRAVLGQQVSVKAANSFAARIAREYGAPLLTGVEGLERLYPSSGDFLALDPIEDALGKLGVIKTRARTISAIAALVENGELKLNPAADVVGQMGRLLAVKGIGVWSQNYIAMRTLAYTDAFLEADAGIRHALPELAPKERSAAVEPCRPWRAYANVCLWNSLAPKAGGRTRDAAWGKRAAAGE